jgi:hypothetical protein
LFCFGDADFVSPKVMYLSFCFTVSAHLLTVLYQMMLGRIQKYVSLGVIWVLYMVLGWFSILCLLLWRGKNQKRRVSASTGPFLPIF